MRRWLSLLISAAIALAPLPAFADAYEAAMARAAAAKEKALDANDPASWQETLRLFEEADALQSTKESRYEVAVAAAWLKQDDLAVEAYQDAIALGLSGPAKAKAASYVEGRVDKMGRLHLVGPSGTVVSIEGHRRARLPRERPLVVFAGTVQLQVEREGVTRNVDLTVKPGEELTVDVEPKQEKKPEAPAPAAVEKPLFSTSTGWTFIASGTVAAGLGVTAILVSGSRISRARDQMQTIYGCRLDGDYCGNITDASKLDGAQSLSDQVATWRGVRTVGIVAAAAGGALAITGIVIVATQPKAPSIRAEASALPGGAFLGLSGAF